MWCLNVAPNGAAKKWVDYFDVFLVLCGLPQGVEYIEVEWRITCKKLDLSSHRQYKFGFEKRNCNDCWTQDDNQQMLSFQEFKLYKNIEIILSIEIKKVWGNYGYQIPEKEWSKFIDPRMRGIGDQKINSIDNDNDIQMNNMDNDNNYNDNDNLEEVMSTFTNAYGISGDWDGYV